MSAPGVARALQPSDADAAREFVERALAGTVYLNRTLELLEHAAEGDVETRALIAGEAVNAIVLFGAVAGAEGTWQIRMMCVTEDLQRHAGRPFMDAFLAVVRKEGARVVVAELPADDVIGDALTLLRANGFRQTGKVADYYRDGVALLFLRREL